MEIKFQDKIYKIDLDKTIYFLSVLENISKNHIKEDEILKLLEKYRLLDEKFLSSISK